MVRTRPHTCAPVVFQIPAAASDEAHVVVQAHASQEAISNTSGVWVRLANSKPPLWRGEGWLLAAPPNSFDGQLFWTPIPNIDYTRMGRTMLASTLGNSNEGLPWVCNLENFAHTEGLRTEPSATATQIRTEPSVAPPLLSPGIDDLTKLLVHIVQKYGDGTFGKVLRTKGMLIPPTLLHALLLGGCSQSTFKIAIDALLAPTQLTAEKDKTQQDGSSANFLSLETSERLDFVDEGGRTALLIACQLGNIECSHILLAAGASPTKRCGVDRRLGLDDDAAAISSNSEMWSRQSETLEFERGDKLVPIADVLRTRTAAKTAGWIFGMNPRSRATGWFPTFVIDPPTPVLVTVGLESGGCSSAPLPLIAAVDLWFARLSGRDAQNSECAVEESWNLIETLVSSGATQDCIDADGHTIVTRMLRLACGSAALFNSPLMAPYGPGWRCSCGFVNQNFMAADVYAETRNPATTSEFDQYSENCEVCGTYRDRSCTTLSWSKHYAPTGNGTKLVSDNIVIAACHALARLGCSLTEADAVWETPLHIAAHRTTPSVARILVDGGADDNHPLLHRPSGTTSLAFAALGGRAEIFEFLLEHCLARAGVCFAKGDTWSGTRFLPSSQFESDIRGSLWPLPLDNGGERDSKLVAPFLVHLVRRQVSSHIFMRVLEYAVPTLTTLLEVVEELQQIGRLETAMAVVHSSFQNIIRKAGNAVGFRYRTCKVPLHIYDPLRAEIKSLLSAASKLKPVRCRASESTDHTQSERSSAIAHQSSSEDGSGLIQAPSSPPVPTSNALLLGSAASSPPPLPPPVPTANELLQGFKMSRVNTSWQNPELKSILDHDVIKNCVISELHNFAKRTIQWSECELIRALPWSQSTLSEQLIGLLTYNIDSSGSFLENMLLAENLKNSDAGMLATFIINKLPVESLRELGGWVCKLAIGCDKAQGKDNMFKLIAAYGDRASPLDEDTINVARECGLIKALRRLAVDTTKNKNRIRAGELLAAVFPDDAVKCSICDCAATLQPVCVQSGGEHYKKIQCDCTYCGECLQQWITATIESGSTSIRCPTEGCKFVLYGDDVQRLGTAEAHSLFNTLKNRDGTERLAEIARDPSMKDWLAANTRVCPSCSVIVERSAGCNAMRCSCGAGFSWNTALNPVVYENERAEGETDAVGEVLGRRRGWFSRLLHWGSGSHTSAVTVAT